LKTATTHTDTVAELTDLIYSKAKYAVFLHLLDCFVSLLCPMSSSTLHLCR